MKTSQAGRNALSASEGTRLTAYRDGGGVLTIGRGITDGVYVGMTITPEQEESMFAATLVKYEDAVNKLVTEPLTQNQFDALVSFTYNVGIKAFANSSLRRMLNSGDYLNAADQFPRWDMDNGQHIPGLQARRVRERAMFLRDVTPDPKPLPPISPDLVIPAPKPSLFAALIALFAKLFAK